MASLLDAVVSLRERFGENLERVRGLVELYQEVTGNAQGRSSVRESEILRAAVILLHASVEDLFRGIGMIRLPAAGREILDKVPYAGGDGRGTPKWSLGDLSSYGGRSVDDVIWESIQEYLDRRSYNSPDDLASALRQVGLPPELIAPTPTGWMSS